MNKRTLRTTKLKKNICKTFYRLKMKGIQKEISEINSPIITNAVRPENIFVAKNLSKVLKLTLIKFKRTAVFTLLFYKIQVQSGLFTFD